MSDLSETVLSPRIAREERTVQLMIGLYCCDNHQTASDICVDCCQLMEYAHARLMHCPFLLEKPTCAHCPVHCYKPEMREHIRQVMKYAGPRMLLHHPILTIHHLLDGRIKARRKTKE